MANIFKTTLKKDVIADIANGQREVRFPITKFWATRITDEYNLDDKTFVFKTFDSLEFSSPSNKETGGETYVFDFDKTIVDGDEFVMLFKEHVDVEIESCSTDDVKDVELDNNVSDVKVEKNTDEVTELVEDKVEDKIKDLNIVSEGSSEDEVESLNISNEDVFTLLTQWFEEEKILDNFYDDNTVFATNAKQVIILPKGKILGSKKSVPLNNDVEVRIEFNTNEKIYFDSILDFDLFEDEILNTLNEIRKNNYVFVWKRYTGIFMDENGIYFGIKYSTRKSVGFNRKYSVQ